MQTYSVLGQAEYGRARQNDLVHKVEHVRDKEDRDDGAVNLAQHATGHASLVTASMLLCRSCVGKFRHDVVVVVGGL